MCPNSHFSRMFSKIFFILSLTVLQVLSEPYMNYPYPPVDYNRIKSCYECFGGPMRGHGYPMGRPPRHNLITIHHGARGGNPPFPNGYPYNQNNVINGSPSYPNYPGPIRMYPGSSRYSDDYYPNDNYIRNVYL